MTFNVQLTDQRIIFFGTSAFAIPVLETLVKEKYRVVAVITTPDEPTGRKQILTPPPIKLAAQRLGLPVLQPLNLKDPDFLKVINYELKVDLGIVAAYGKIIPSELINSLEHGIINIHPSLLPKYRGPSPIQSAILNGEQETGVTIIKIDQQVDHGPILAQSEKWKTQNKKYKELHDELAVLGAELLIKTLPDYLAGKIKLVEQDYSQVTFTKIIKKEDGRINWHQEAQQIYNQFRAFHVWPEICTTWKDKILKVTDCQVSENQPYHGHEKIYIGVVYEENGMIYVPCGKGHIEIQRVQLEGGKEMPINDFLSGHRDFIGSLLE